MRLITRRLRLFALLLPLVLTGILAAVSVPPVASEGPSATVVATNVVYLRACPVLTCKTVTSVPLGAEVTIAGETIDGFAPIRWQQYEGWVYDLFLSRSGEVALVREGISGCDRVALIFNAGIGETPSQSILDTLVASQTPATLFAMGWWAETYPGYLQAMANDANVVIGTHGNTQQFLTHASDERIVAEVNDSADAIESVTGLPTARYFTPYASDSDERVRRLIAEEGYLPIGWTAAAGDYNDDDTADDVYQRVMDGARDGAIIELHLDGPATEESTAEVLPEIIRDLEAEGYTLVTVPEIILPCPTGP